MMPVLQDITFTDLVSETVQFDPIQFQRESCIPIFARMLRLYWILNCVFQWQQLKFQNISTIFNLKFDNANS